MKHKKPEKKTFWKKSSVVFIDYETEVIPAAVKEQIAAGAVNPKDVLVSAYSFQITFKEEEFEEVRGTKKTGAKRKVSGKEYERNASACSRKEVRTAAEPRYTTYILLSDLITKGLTKELCEKYNVIKVHGDVIREGFRFLIGMIPAVKNKRVIHCKAFNSGFEESYSLKSLFEDGFYSDTIIDLGQGGILSSSFRQEYCDVQTDIFFEETSKHYGAGTKLTEVFQMFGFEAKTDTPLYSDMRDVVADKTYLEYAQRDTEIAYKCEEKQIELNGNPNTRTASSTTKFQHKLWFVDKYGKDVFDSIFIDASPKMDRWLRPLTLGGYNYVYEGTQNRWLQSGTVFSHFIAIDATNAYLSRMVLSKRFPVGKGSWFTGKYEHRDDKPFYYQEVIIKKAVWRKNRMPYLQIRGLERTESVEGLDLGNDDFSEEQHHFIITSDEMEMIHKCYIINENDIVYVRGVCYEEMTGEYLFGEYLRGCFYDRRELKKQIKKLKAQLAVEKEPAEQSRLTLEINFKTAMANTKKLWGNGLYGKEFEKSEKIKYEWARNVVEGQTVYTKQIRILRDKKGEIIWEKDEDGNVVYRNGEPVPARDIKEKPSCSYIGAYVLRLQRLAIVQCCNALMELGYRIIQVDTDSFLVGVPVAMKGKQPEEICKDAGIDYGDDLGKWHLEKFAMSGVSVAKKCYLWTPRLLTQEQQDTKIIDLMRQFYNEKNPENTDVAVSNKVIYEWAIENGEFFMGTRGISKYDVCCELTPRQFRFGVRIHTTGFRPCMYNRKAQIPLVKVLALTPDKFEEGDEDDDSGE